MGRASKNLTVKATLFTLDVFYYTRPIWFMIVFWLKNKSKKDLPNEYSYTFRNLEEPNYIYIYRQNNIANWVFQKKNKTKPFLPFSNRVDLIVIDQKHSNRSNKLFVWVT